MPLLYRHCQETRKVKMLEPKKEVKFDGRMKGEMLVFTSSQREISS